MTTRTGDFDWRAAVVSVAVVLSAAAASRTTAQETATDRRSDWLPPSLVIGGSESTGRVEAVEEATEDIDDTAGRSGADGLALARPQEGPSTDRSTGRLSRSAWNAATALAAAFLVLLVGAGLLRKRGGRFRSLRLPDDAVELLGRRSLDGGRSIELVRCGSRILVLGCAGESITRLAEITDPAEVDDLTEVCRGGPDLAMTDLAAGRAR